MKQLPFGEAVFRDRFQLLRVLFEAGGRSGTFSGRRCNKHVVRPASYGTLC